MSNMPHQPAEVSQNENTVNDPRSDGDGGDLMLLGDAVASTQPSSIHYYQQQQKQQHDRDPIGATISTTTKEEQELVLLSQEIPPELLFTNTPAEDDEYFAFLQDPYAGSPGGLYSTYEVPVEHDEGDRGMEIRLRSWKRPHMRALHCAWISFFLAFTIWFSPAPLLKEIQDTLGLSKKDIWNASICNDSKCLTFCCLVRDFTCFGCCQRLFLNKIASIRLHWYLLFF